MSSTPSASALSAVLRCRGNIWTRNPQTKRPASASSLGPAVGTLRCPPTERSGRCRGSDRSPPALFSGGLAVSSRWDTGVRGPPVEEGWTKNQKLFMSEHRERPRSGAPSGLKAPLQQLLALSSFLQNQKLSRILLVPPGGSTDGRGPLLKLSIIFTPRVKVHSPRPLVSLKALIENIGTDPLQEDPETQEPPEHSCSSGREMTPDRPD